MAITVQRVVGELHLIEDDRLRRPVRPKCWPIRMEVDALGALRFGTARRYPLGSAELEPTVTDRDHLQQDEVVLFRLQPVH